MDTSLQANIYVSFSGPEISGTERFPELILPARNKFRAGPELISCRPGINFMANHMLEIDSAEKCAQQDSNVLKTNTVKTNDELMMEEFLVQEEIHKRRYDYVSCIAAQQMALGDGFNHYGPI